MTLKDSIIEGAALTWLGEGYWIGHGPQLAPSEPATERDASGEVKLVGHLLEAIRQRNPVAIVKESSSVQTEEPRP